MDWRRAFLGIIIITACGFVFFLTASKFSISLSAAYNRTDSSDDSLESISGKNNSVPKTIRHKNTVFTTSINKFSDQINPRLWPFIESVSNLENSVICSQSSSLIHAIKSSVAGFGALEEFPVKLENKNMIDEIKAENITIPPSFTHNESERILREFTTLVEEQ